ncbi:MAG: uroporphyrinogen decarboxylase family protein [Candidatus Spyradocola sp.]|jgi:uroporphyrinogen-III decarboxylase
MDKRERVLACMNHLSVDRPPVGFWFHFADDQKMGEACVQAHLDYYNHVDVDLVKIMCDGYFDYPNPLAQSVQKASDWYHLKPLGKNHPFLREQVDRAKAVKDGLKDDMCVFYNVFAPFSSIRFGTSDDMVMAHLREDPQAIAYALGIIAEDNSTLCELLMTEAGCDGIYYCVQGGEKDRMTGETYRAYITPSDKAVLSHANKFSPYNILHCCGWAGIPNRLENWQDYPAKVINWAVFIEQMDLVRGRAFFGGKTVLGGCDNRKTGVLYTGSKAEVQSFVRKLVSSFDQDTGYMIGADCTLPGDIDKARIQWVVDAVNSL